ncbi:MAG: TetR/AcrR family transcriptional regulator [Firmicutes bacterium]|nr:TetR/AcrR family transcriptional regulator [Bacillota bacterium]
MVDRGTGGVTGQTNETPLDEKRKQILQAALKEFARSGYEGASTNRIIKDAGVSKGLLFYYFESKKDLYLETADMCLQYFELRVGRELTTMSDDIVDRIVEIGRVKLKTAAEQPLMYRLLSDVFLDPPEDLKEELDALQSRLRIKYLPYLTENIDWSRFRDGVDRQKAVGLITLVVDSIGGQYARAYRDSGYKHSSDLDDAIHEIQIYLDMLKHGVYK